MNWRQRRPLAPPIGSVLARLPAYPGSWLFARLLNATLAPQLAADTRAGLEGKLLQLRVSDMGVAFNVSWRGRGFTAHGPGATPDPQARDSIARALLAHNATFLGPPASQFLAALLHSADGEVIGGLWGRTALRWLFVEILYVPETLRGQQIGTRLLQTAETEARARGCLLVAVGSLIAAIGAPFMSQSSLDT